MERYTDKTWYNLGTLRVGDKQRSHDEERRAFGIPQDAGLSILEQKTNLLSMPFEITDHEILCSVNVVAISHNGIEYGPFVVGNINIPNVPEEEEIGLTVEPWQFMSERELRPFPELTDYNDKYLFGGKRK